MYYSELEVVIYLFIYLFISKPPHSEEIDIHDKTI